MIVFDDELFRKLSKISELYTPLLLDNSAGYGFTN